MSQDRLDVLEGKLLRLRELQGKHIADKNEKKAYVAWVKIRSCEVDIEIMKFRINKYKNTEQ